MSAFFDFDPEFCDFVHERHMGVFFEAARVHECHILVRRTGRASLRFVGKPGYTGKRADMKAKTAERDQGRYQLAGLVCSPEIHPAACKEGAMAEWRKSAHLITAPRGGFDDRARPVGCRTPYLLQTDPNHRHYGCVAFVENGLLTPHYVHGDYDLFAIIPVKPKPEPRAVERLRMPADIMALPSMPFKERLRREEERNAKAVHDLVGEFSFKVATFINVRIAASEPGMAGALMVNHGEHVNQADYGGRFQAVLAFMPEKRDGQYGKILRDQQDHEAFYGSA